MNRLRFFVNQGVHIESGADMPDASLALYAAAAGAAGVVVMQTGMRAGKTKADQALILFAVALCLNSVLNGVIGAWPGAPQWVQVLPAVCLAVLAPALWLYVDDLTSSQALRWRAKDAWPFALAGVALVFAGAIASLPPPSPADVGAASPLGTAYRAAIAFNVGLMLAIMVLSTYFVWRVLLRLCQLTGQLKQVFSDTSDRDLTWLWIVIGLLVLNWIATLVHNLGLIELPELVFGILGLAFTLAWGPWATMQKPVFQGEGTARIALPDEAASAQQKYERSLLPDERLQRIAAKIEAAFETKGIHLDPSLSLRKLSEHLSIPEVHLSQTFTRQLGSTFYDTVNRRRVEAAKERLATSDNTITDISYAVGFNSRSAFYAAFKEVTGQTPSEFRAAAKSKG